LKRVCFGSTEAESDTVFSNAVSHGETNMRDNYSDDQASKPDSGNSDQSRHEHKDNRSATGNSGVVSEHPEKTDGKNRTEPLSKPGSSGGGVREEKRDENTSNPEGALGPVPKDRQHLSKAKAHESRKFEPRPRGEHDSSGRPFKSTKRG